MPNFKFGQKEIASEELKRQIQVTDITMIDINKIVLSDKVRCNNGKNLRTIEGYQVDGETVMPRFIKTPKNIFSYGVSQYDKNSVYSISYTISEDPKCTIHHQNIWNEVELQLISKADNIACKRRKQI